MITDTPCMQSRLARFALVALAMILSLWAGLASGNGRATLVSSQQAGPYQIDVSLIPATPVMDNTHLSILVRALSDQHIVTDATVTISATGPEGSTAFGPLEAPNDAAPQFYELTLPFDAAGVWEVSVSVTSELGEATILAPLDVQPGGGVNWILITALLVAIIAVGVFTWDRVAGRKKKPAAVTED